MKNPLAALAFASFVAVACAAEPAAVAPEAWDYAPAMRKVAAKFSGQEGVVLHIGDSMTIANPYTQWARSGKGKTPADEAILKWMHTGANNKTDGWWLCRTEVVHERAYTSVGGMQSTHLLAGGNRDNPTLAQMLADFKPRLVIIQVGIYDTNANRPTAEYRANMAKAADLCLANGVICILSTCAPLHHRLDLSKEHNAALRAIAQERGLPLIDLEREILTRRPDDWNGTLQRRNNIHLTASEAGGNAGAAPTPENLGKSGYLLRGWLSVQKVAEVKRRVLDASPEAQPGAAAGALAAQLAKLDGRVIELGTVRQPPLAPMLANDARAGLREANQADRRAWEQVTTRAEWEKFRDARLQALRTALGQFPPAPKGLKLRVTGALTGDGYRVANLVFESQPGLVVTANLYQPTKAPASMPALIICHSHQQPKNTDWRQDMAMTWARAGCLVLVPDHLGHGERRQHPFASAADFGRPFAVPRQDYWFRYDAGMQLDLIGDSLMGWLAWDLARGVDVLLMQPAVDPKRVIIVSEPAGGGDVAAVAAALDPRITGAVITNFGGPQPETAYPLPRDAEQSFDFAGSGSWESTRNLRRSARDGFLPWLIVAAPAPRRVIYNHEFYWDRDNDPVWKRLQKVYGFYNAGDALAGIGARGFVVGSAPENMHWLASNRELLYPTFERWFGIPNPKQEYSNRRPPEDLNCLTPPVLKDFSPLPLHEIAARLGTERGATARAALERLPAAERRARLREHWARLLGDVAVKGEPVVRDRRTDELPGVRVERIHLATEPGIVVPVLLLVPTQAQGKRPVVLALAQGGKQEFLRQRSALLAELLAGGVAVCLPDLRGTGETSPGPGRDRGSPATALSASNLMLGQPLVGARLRDLDAVLRHLRTHPELDSQRLALWGDSFAAPNTAAGDLCTPHGVADRPAQSEPLGGLLALLGALYHDEVRAVAVHGGLSSYAAVLHSPCCYLPHDAIVPGALTVGDLPTVAAVLAPRPLRLDGLVDGLNRRIAPDAVAATYGPARAAYRTAGAEQHLTLPAQPAAGIDIARWLLAQLQGG